MPDQALPPPASPPFGIQPRPVGVTVIDFRRADRKGVSTDELTGNLTKQLSDVSGRPWQVQRVIPWDGPPPTRGDGLALKDVLDKAGAWGDGQVWLIGDSTLGAQEHYLGNPQEGLWDGGGNFTPTSNITASQFSRPLAVSAFNTERPEQVLHTVGHALESTARHYDVNGLREYSGRPESDPLHVNSLPSMAPVPAYDGGHGTIHVPPGSRYQYQGYDRQGSPWGGNEQGFYRWWETEAPRRWWDDLAGDGDDVQRAPGTGSAGTGAPFRPSDVANAASSTSTTSATPAALAGSAVATP